MVTQYEQLSLFAMGLPGEAIAIRCEDGTQQAARRPDDWMVRLVSNGEYVVDVGEHPLVLRPVNVRPEDIPAGHHYYHYLIEGRVYAGIFVGSDIRRNMHER